VTRYRPPRTVPLYFFLPARLACARSDAAAVFSALVDFLSASTLAAALAAFLLVAIRVPAPCVNVDVRVLALTIAATADARDAVGASCGAALTCSPAVLTG